MTNPTNCRVSVAYGDPNPAGLPVAVGVPFAQGKVRPETPFAVRSPAGEVQTAGSRPLARWSDGSVRWALLSFGARQAGTFELLPGQTVKAGGPAVALRHQGERWTIESDRLRLMINETGPGLIGELVVDGHPYLAKPGDLRLCVDDASTLHEKRRTVRVLEQSSRRVRLRIEGGHYRAKGKRRLSYRLDVEVWAGWPAVRLDYHYFHLEPKQPSLKIKRIAVEAAWNLSRNTQRHFLQRNYGLFYVSRHVFNPAPVAIVADFTRGDPHVEKPAMLLDDVDYPFYLHAPLVSTPEWLGVGDGRHAVYAQIGDFLVARPNRLASQRNRLDAEVWPTAGGTLDLPQGRSRRQSVVFAFVAQDPTVKDGEIVKLSNAPRQAPQGVAATLGALAHEGRACVDPAWIASCGEFEQDRVLPVGKHVRVENNLAGFMTLDFPSTKFDVGDTNSAYAVSYASIIGTLVPPLAGAPKIPRIWPGQNPTQTYLDCHEPVWTNNEYDALHAFCGEVMRTGRTELWPTLRLAVRHNIEVDFVHYSDHRWQHRATPAHSARHTTTGAYPSHFWTQGLLEYYCLTGDIDALEVALALGDATVDRFADPELRPVMWGFNREIGWSILTLACLYDVTREERFRPLLEELVNFVVGYDREKFSGAVNLSSGNDRQSLNRQIVGNFFGYASMVEGVDLYATTTGRADVAAWLERFCQDLATEGLNAAREGSLPGINFSMALVTGYERTKDERFLKLMPLLLDPLYWNGPGLTGGGSIKPVGMAYHGLTRLFGHAWRHGLLDQYEFPGLRGTPSQ